MMFYSITAIMGNIKLFILYFLLLSVRGKEMEEDSNESMYKVVCYYPNWAYERDGVGYFVPENINTSLCTHIIYAFAKIESNRLAPYESNDESSGNLRGMYERFNDMKGNGTIPAFKSLLAVGGWTHGSENFTEMVSSNESRAVFIEDAINYLRKYRFDGLDLDWEYPTQRGSPLIDKERFVLLVKELRQAFEAESVPEGREKLILAAAVAAGWAIIDSAYDIPALAREFDFINLMTYDLRGSWEPKTNGHAPLYPRSAETGNDTKLNVEWAVNKWLDEGTPQEKLIMGIPLYGRTWTVNTTAASLLSKTDDKYIFMGPETPAIQAGKPGNITNEAGFWSFYEICEFLEMKGTTKMMEEEQKIPYAYNVGLDQWVGYDDEASIRIKVDFLKSKALGGAMVWDMTLDDFEGAKCGRGSYPLLSAVNTALTESDDVKTSEANKHIFSKWALLIWCAIVLLMDFFPK